MVARIKTSDERRLLVLKGKVLTARGKLENTKEEMQKTQAEIDALKKKGIK